MEQFKKAAQSMNRNYNYAGMEVWDEKSWENVLPIDNLVQWMSRLAFHADETAAGIADSEIKRNKDFAGMRDNISENERSYWDRLGMRVELHSIWIAKWISLVPKTAVRNSGVLLPTIVCIHTTDIQDSEWANQTLERYRALGEFAAKKGRIFLITATNGPDESRQYANILMEAASLYPVDYNSIFLNVSPVYDTGHTLSETPGGVACDARGNTFGEPDSAVTQAGDSGFSLLPVDETWRSTGSPSWGQLIGPDGHNAGNPSYDPNRFVHTLAAQRLVEPMRLEQTYKTHQADGLLHHWAGMGLQYEAHETNQERWVTLVPRTALETGKKLPVMLIFQEVYFSNDHLPVEAASYWYEYVKIAAQGECMLLFYAAECDEHNKLMLDVFQEACRLYPIDTTRVYTTGYSHNSRNAACFAYNNPDVVTAIAGAMPGMSLMGLPQEMLAQEIARLRNIDMPCIHVQGLCEHMCPPGEPSFENSRPAIMQKMNALRAGNCPEKGLEDFKVAFASGDKATRMVGIPNDRSDTLYLEGIEHYIADVKNCAGKFHLRFVAIENAPHTPLPTLQILEWSFVRRFARDPETHQIIEL